MLRVDLRTCGRLLLVGRILATQLIHFYLPTLGDFNQTLPSYLIELIPRVVTFIPILFHSILKEGVWVEWCDNTEGGRMG